MIRRQSAAIVCLLWFWRPAFAQEHADKPETVVITFHAKRGAEAELERVIARHWDTARAMKLVRDTPRVTVRGAEGDGKAYFLDIFTWRDASVPDTAPAEIRRIWDEMNGLVESRGGHPGLEISPVSIVRQPLR
jgi:hypothetical protein